jgi:hypothetical protein
MTPDFTVRFEAHPMSVTRPRRLKILRAFLVIGAATLAACGGDQSGNFVPKSGGVGTVIAARGADAGDATVDADGSGQADVPPLADVAQDAAGTSGAAGSTDAGDAAGDAHAGSGGDASMTMADDPCTACEKARCSKPSGLSSDKGDEYALLFAAQAICFVGNGFPSTQTDVAQCASLDPGPTASAGPEQGMAKTGLCQAVLDCVHKTKCGVNDDRDCYCGAGVTLQACMDPTFVPQGACADVIENAVESIAVNTIFQNYYNICLAAGAAFFVYDNCDSNCCPQQCLGVDMDGDETLCNAPTAGTGGANGTTGAAGALGTAGAPGTAGSSSSGAAGDGGTAGGADNAGAAGAGAAGVSGTAGSASAAAGANGLVGAGGAPGGSLLQNSSFDANVADWIAGPGATVGWSAKDSAATAQSGSLDLSITGGDPNSIVDLIASQCVRVTAGSNYDASAYALVPGPTINLAGIRLIYYASIDCSGSSLATSTSPWSVQATWQPVQISGGAPVGALSAAVQLIAVKPYVMTVGEALFDAVSLTRL